MEVRLPEKAEQEQGQAQVLDTEVARSGLDIPYSNFSFMNKKSFVLGNHCHCSVDF